MTPQPHSSWSLPDCCDPPDSHQWQREPSPAPSTGQGSMGFCTPSLPPHGWLLGVQQSSAAPSLLAVLPSRRGRGRWRARLVPALGLRPSTAQCTGHRRDPFPPPYPATQCQPITTHQRSLPANPTLAPAPSLPPSSLVLLPPITIKPLPGLTNSGAPPSSSPSQPCAATYLCCFSCFTAAAVQSERKGDCSEPICSCHLSAAPANWGQPRPSEGYKGP